MKKIIVGFILGILISGSIVYAASLINSDKVVYTPDNKNWQVNNVKDAIDNLYDAVKDYNQAVSNYNDIVSRYHHVESGSFSISYSSTSWLYKNVTFTNAFTNQPTCFYRYSAGTTGGSVYVSSISKTGVQIGYKTFYQSNCPGGTYCTDTVYWACYE